MYQLLELNNGLRVALEHIPYVNSVSVGLWIKNGSRNENIEVNGISHFMEHMLFKGTDSRNAKEIAEAIEDVGGQLNAFTGKEATCYYAKVLDSHLELALDILSDMLFNSTFKEEEIEREKQVVLEEISMTEDSPEEILSDIHFKGFYGDDPISYPILGKVDTVKSFTKDNIIDFMDRYYTPSNSVISISGNFDKNNIISKIESYFGHWENRKPEKIIYGRPKIIGENYFEEKDIEQIHMEIGLKGIEIGDKDAYTLTMLSNIFGGGASSILFQKLREELGLCYTVYSYGSSMINTGLFCIYTALNPKYLKKSMKAIEEELYKFSTIEFSQDKIKRAKEQMKGGYILGLESTSSRMFNNGRSALFLNTINTPQDILNFIDEIDSDRIKKIQDNIFKEGIKNIALVGKDYNLVKEALEDNFHLKFYRD